LSPVLIFLGIFGSICHMSPEERELLQRCVELAEENNSMLHSMRHSMRLARIMSIAYWVVIIGSAVGALYLIQPYLDAMMGAYGGATGMGNSVDGIRDILNSL